MDPRHESKEQLIINKIITLVNQFLMQQSTLLYTNFSIFQIIRDLTMHLYHFAELSIDVDSVLAKRNLLSLDAVLFPTITELTLSDEKKQQFLELCQSIQNLSNKNENVDLSQFINKLKMAARID